MGDESSAADPRPADGGPGADASEAGGHGGQSTPKKDDAVPLRADGSPNAPPVRSPATSFLRPKEGLINVTDEDLRIVSTSLDPRIVTQTLMKFRYTSYLLVRVSIAE